MELIIFLSIAFIGGYLYLLARWAHAYKNEYIHLDKPVPPYLTEEEIKRCIIYFNQVRENHDE